MPSTTAPASLTRILESATEEASSAMCRWSGGKVTLELKGVAEVPIPEVIDYLDLADKLQVMIVLQITSEMGGSVVLSFDDIDGRTVADTLFPTTWDEESPWNEIQASALKETGNIVACAYLNAVTEASNVELVPSPPYFLSDYGASVVEQLLMPHTMTADSVLVHQVTFKKEGQPLKGILLFLPTESLEKEIQSGIVGNESSSK